MIDESEVFYLCLYISMNVGIRTHQTAVGHVFHFPHERKSCLGTCLCETGVIILSSHPLTSRISKSSLKKRLDTPLLRVMLQTSYPASCSSQVLQMSLVID